MLLAASGPANPFVLLVCETNTNARAGEVTLDFHTDRFSFFFFNEISGEGEGRWLMEHYYGACNCLYSSPTYLL